MDRISGDKVPVSALLDVWSLDGVVVVEQQDVMVPMLDTSVPTTNFEQTRLEFLVLRV